jgi:serine/threonine protein kinase
MIAKLTPRQISEFEDALNDCAHLSTDEERRVRLGAVADATVRSLLELAFEEPVSARNLRSGIQIAGYELIESLGGGGFGEVWRACGFGNDSNDVAIKFIRDEHLRGGSAEMLANLFQAEIQRHRRLDHAAIVKPIATGSVLLSEHLEPTPYLVMELCPGRPLHHACRGQAVEKKIACLIRVCEAVQYAHRHGLMHLDLKPENILVAEKAGHLLPKLLDFGIARNFRAERPIDTSRFGAGTLPYKAPEQIDFSLGGENFRTDVYALGVLLFQVLTDHLPYPIKEGTTAEFKVLIQSGSRLGLDLFDKTLDGALQEICDCAMALDRARRYDSPARLAEALRRWLRRGTASPRRWALAGGAAAILACVAVLLWKRSIADPTDIEWRSYSVNTNGLNLGETYNWYDIAWSENGNDGWLCGSRNEDATPGRPVGEGFVWHTTNGGHDWKEMPRTNFPIDSGTFTCFERKKWEGVGPLNYIKAKKLQVSNEWVTSVCLAGMTGIYFTTNGNRDDARWTRLTPPPDGPDC